MVPHCFPSLKHAPTFAIAPNLYPPPPLPQSASPNALQSFKGIKTVFGIACTQHISFPEIVTRLLLDSNEEVCARLMFDLPLAAPAGKGTHTLGAFQTPCPL